MEAWVGQLALKEAEPILHLIDVLLCGNIDVARAFCAFHLGINRIPSVSYFNWFCGVQKLTLCLTLMVEIACPVMLGAAMKTVPVARLVLRHGTIFLFLTSCYRLALGQLGHSRSHISFHLHRADKSHSCLIFLLPATIVLAGSGWFETVCHMQYGIVCLQENIKSCQRNYYGNCPLIRHTYNLMGLLNRVLSPSVLDPKSKSRNRKSNQVLCTKSNRVPCKQHTYSPIHATTIYDLQDHN